MVLLGASTIVVFCHSLNDLCLAGVSSSLLFLLYSCMVMCVGGSVNLAAGAW